MFDKLLVTVLLAGVCLLHIGCDKAPDITEQAPASNLNGLLVCNEGNFNWGNASLSLINLDNETVNPDVFFGSNNRKLGDVLQSACYIDNKLFLVVNNSEKIEVVNAETFKHIATIKNLKSPRYMAQVSSNMAYVTDLYDNAVSIVDLTTYAKTGSIAMPGWTEELLVYDGRAFITNLRTDYALVVNTSQHQVQDTIRCGYGSNSIVKDKYNNIWLLASGSETLQKKPTLTCYNPQLKIIIKQFVFKHYGSPRKLIIDEKGETLYWLFDGNVYAMETASESIPDKPLIKAEGRNFYGLDFYPKVSNIVVTDAKDYVQQGDVLIYDRFGKLLKQFKAGVIPCEVIQTR